MISRSISLLALLLLAPSLPSATAWAQGTSARAEDAPNAALRAEAREHFDRGIELFNEGRLEASLAELQRAYEIAPAYPVLYNLARVHAELGHPVEAARDYRRYLEEGGAQISAARRTEVEGALARQRSRIGTIAVLTDIEGAIISIDGIDLATSPAAPIEVGVGVHTLGVRAPGREAITRAVHVASGTESRIEIALRAEIPARGTLRISTTVPGARISLDGSTLGISPLEGTIPVAPGEHDLRAERAGYLSEARRVHVEDGAEYEVAFRMERDPAPHPSAVGALTLRLPEGSHAVQIDGEQQTPRGPIQLPIGAHLVEVEMAEREPWAGEVEIAPGQTAELAPPLRWTVQAHRARVEGARSMELAGITLTLAGSALLVGGLALVAWNEAEIADTDARVREAMAEYARRGCPLSPDPQCAAVLELRESLGNAQGVQDALRPSSVAAAILGAATITLGVVLWVSAPSVPAIERSAHAVLRVGPSTIALQGSF